MIERRQIYIKILNLRQKFHNSIKKVLIKGLNLTKIISFLDLYHRVINFLIYM